PTDRSTLSLHDALPILAKHRVEYPCEVIHVAPEPAPAALPRDLRGRHLAPRERRARGDVGLVPNDQSRPRAVPRTRRDGHVRLRSEEHTSELQSRENLV